MKEKKTKLMFGTLLAVALLATSFGLLAVTDDNMSAEAPALNVSGTGIDTSGTATTLEVGADSADGTITLAIANGYTDQITVQRVNLGNTDLGIVTGYTITDNVITIVASETVGSTVIVEATATAISVDTAGVTGITLGNPTWTSATEFTMAVSDLAYGKYVDVGQLSFSTGSGVLDGSNLVVTVSAGTTAVTISGNAASDITVTTNGLTGITLGSPTWTSATVFTMNISGLANGTYVDSSSFTVTNGTASVAGSILTVTIDGGATTVNVAGTTSSITVSLSGSNMTPGAVTWLTADSFTIAMTPSAGYTAPAIGAISITGGTASAITDGVLTVTGVTGTSVTITANAVPIDYTVSITDPNVGGPASVTVEDSTITITVAQGYQITSGPSVTGATGTWNGNVFTITAITGNITIDVTAAVIEYNVTINGSNITGPSSVTVNDTTITLTVAAGYEISGTPMVTGATGTWNGNVFTISSITGNVDITVTTALIDYTVTINGSNVSGPSSVTVNDTEITLVVATGYEINGTPNVTGATGSWNGNVFTITAISGNITIDVTTGLIAYIVNINGSHVYGPNTVTVNDTEITLTLDPGYEISGTPAVTGATGTWNGKMFTITAITGNITIDVTTALINYTVTINGDHVSGPSSVTVNDTTITLMVDAGYEISGTPTVTGANGSWNGNVYTMTDITANGITIDVTVTAINYAVTVNGSNVTGPSTVTVNDTEITLTVDAGYQITGIPVVTGATGTWNGNVFTISSITGNVDITVTTVLITYTVTINGTHVSGPSSVTVNDSNITLDLVAGYEITGIPNVTGATGSWNGNVFTITAITGNITIEVTVTAINYAVTLVGSNVSGPSSVTVNDTEIALVADQGYRITGTPAVTGATGSWNGNVFTITAITGNVTITVTTEAISYTVTFDSQGADTPANPTTKTVTYPATTVDALPTAPVRDGYVFGGWFTGTNGEGTGFTAATAVTGDVTVYALWTAVYTISGNAGVEGATVTLSITGGGTLTAISGNDGTYSITGVPAGTQGSLSASLLGYSFSGPITVNALTGDLTGQDFTATSLAPTEVVIGTGEAQAFVDNAVDGNVVISTESSSSNSVELSAASVANLQNALNDGITAVQFKLPGNISVSIPADTFKGLTGGIVVSASKLAIIPDEIKDAVPDGSTLLDLSAVTGSSDVAGPFTVTVNVGNPNGNLRIWHIDENGNATQVGDVTVDADGNATFTVDHFSYYALEPFAVGSPAGDDPTLIVAAIVIVALVALIAIIGYLYYRSNHGY